MGKVPTKLFFTNGTGRHKNKLESFEYALRNADIALYNLVRVSSIFPPHCQIIKRVEGSELLSPGEIVYCVMADIHSDEPGRILSAGIGLAQASKKKQHGYISEHHCCGMTEPEISDYVEDMAASMLASTLGIEFDPDANYDERKEIYKMSGQIVETGSIVQTATCDKEGWTTVVAAAVFVD